MPNTNETTYKTILNLETDLSVENVYKDMDSSIEKSEKKQLKSLMKNIDKKDYNEWKTNFVNSEYEKIKDKKYLTCSYMFAGIGHYETTFPAEQLAGFRCWINGNGSAFCGEPREATEEEVKTYIALNCAAGIEKSDECKDMSACVKDIFGQEIRIGDLVGVVYKEDAYVVYTTFGNVIDIDTRIVTIRTDGGDEFGIQIKDGKVTKAVKINDYLPAENGEIPVDAAGQQIHVGDHVAVMRKVELGTTCKGFFDGGKVTKITAKFVFFENAGQYGESRKSFDKVVVVRP